MSYDAIIEKKHCSRGKQRCLSLSHDSYLSYDYFRFCVKKVESPLRTLNSLSGGAGDGYVVRGGKYSHYIFLVRDFSFGISPCFQRCGNSKIAG